jgi:hypothetical protein
VRNVPALTVTVDWAAGVATVAVRELLGAAKVTAPEPASGDAGAEPGFRPGDTGGRQR